MNALGCRTGCAGKLHHAPARDTKGFAFARLMEESRLGPDDDYFQFVKSRHPEVERIFNYDPERLVFDFDDEDHYEHWIASQSIAFLESTPAADPFFLWTSFQGPHTPLDPPRSVKGTCRAEGLPARIDDDEPTVPVHRTRRAVFDETVYTDATGEGPANGAIREAYAESIVFIDRQVGRLLEALESSGRLDNTTILFTSDHGDLLGDHGQITKGPFAWRGNLDIPLIVANHPALAPGTRSDALVGNIDVPGTVLDIAGDERGIGHARSLLEMVDDDAPARREVIFSEHADLVKIVDTDRWRFAYYPFTGARELFDRASDPDELTNLSRRPEAASVEAELLAHVVDFMCLAKGLELPAYDFGPEQQRGVTKKHPNWKRHRDIPPAFPLTEAMKARLRVAGVEDDYDEWVKLGS
jgi:arylsulfatase A-like enzyme